MIRFLSLESRGCRPSVDITVGLKFFWWALFFEQHLSSDLEIVPDDKLWDLPFQSLLTSANRVLIEKPPLLMALDLKADLVMLSACERARSFGVGEGMIGLTWPLFVAGVPTTVVSQWKVESASTRDLMVNFHRGLSSPPRAVKTKATKTEALRVAARKVMKNPDTSHPFYWASFVLVGDGR